MSSRTWKQATPAHTGRLAHRVIADVLRAATEGQQIPRGDWRRVLDAVDERMRQDGYRDRAARQTITAAVLGYLETLPPPPWQFGQAEAPVPGGRVDVLWTRPDQDAVIADEVKTGHGGAELTSTRAQADRYLGALRRQHRDVAIRVLSTRAPETSWTLSSPQPGNCGTDPVAGRGPPPS